MLSNDCILGTVLGSRGKTIAKIRSPSSKVLQSRESYKNKNTKILETQYDKCHIECLLVRRTSAHAHTHTHTHTHTNYTYSITAFINLDGKNISNHLLQYLNFINNGKDGIIRGRFSYHTNNDIIRKLSSCIFSLFYDFSLK
jgi:hypothetical protein